MIGPADGLRPREVLIGKDDLAPDPAWRFANFGGTEDVFQGPPSVTKQQLDSYIEELNSGKIDENDPYAIAFRTTFADQIEAAQQAAQKKSAPDATKPSATASSKRSRMFEGLASFGKISRSTFDASKRKAPRAQEEPEFRFKWVDYLERVVDSGNPSEYRKPGPFERGDFLKSETAINLSLIHI